MTAETFARMLFGRQPFLFGAQPTDVMQLVHPSVLLLAAAVQEQQYRYCTVSKLLIQLHFASRLYRLPLAPLNICFKENYSEKILVCAVE